MKFIFIFAVVFLKVCFIHLSKVMEIVGAFGIDAFMEDEMLSVFLWNKGVSAVRTAQFHGRKFAFFRREPGGADFAQELSFGAVVFVEVWLWGITAGTGAVLRDVAF